MRWSAFLARSQVAFRLVGHIGGITAVVMTPDDKHAITASKDTTVSSFSRSLEMALTLMLTLTLTLPLPLVLALALPVLALAL